MQGAFFWRKHNSTIAANKCHAQTNESVQAKIQLSFSEVLSLAVFGVFLLILICLVTERNKHFFKAAPCLLTGNGGSPPEIS